MHLTEQTDQPKPTVFPKCWTSCNNEVNVILKYGKGGGRGGRTSLLQLEFYFDASLFVIYIYVSFFLFLFTWLFVSFFFSTEGNNLSVYEISCYLFVGVCMFNVDLFCGHFCTGRKIFLKTVLLLNGFTSDSLKEIEEKVTYTRTEGKK